MELIRSIKEAFSSLKQNKSRSILAGFGVAWGIFILILLLGTGKGFQQGILQLFSVFAKNSIWVYGGQISETSSSNVNLNRQVLFDNDDIKILKDRFPDIEYMSPELNYYGNALVSNQQNIAYAQIRGVISDYFNVKIINTEEGRLLNTLDNKEYRQVALVGKQVADALFPNETAVGKSININGTYFKVIGVIEKGSLFTQGEQNIIYLPYNSFVQQFNQGREFNAFILTLSKKTNTSDFENKLKTVLGRKKGFSVDDKKAIFIVNFESQVKSFNKLFKGVDLFLWFIGLSLLLSGIVGICNIMFVIVKERTFEIGIRKAIGAKSRSIIYMIITESIVITGLAGLFGLLLGVGCVGLINLVLNSYYKDSESLFSNAVINFPIIIFSLVILIISGILAGLIPAKRASEITPIEALRFESK